MLFFGSTVGINTAFSGIISLTTSAMTCVSYVPVAMRYRWFVARSPNNDHTLDFARSVTLVKTMAIRYPVLNSEETSYLPGAFVAGKTEFSPLMTPQTIQLSTFKLFNESIGWMSGPNTVPGHSETRSKQDSCSSRKPHDWRVE